MILTLNPKFHRVDSHEQREGAGTDGKASQSSRAKI
jgi:hypothetical protein